jgi:uncharacterized hydrophobic protein (TIGR00271 family)
VQHVTAISPADRTHLVSAVLRANSGVTNLVILPGAALRPAGDLVMCDVAREAVEDTLTDLRRLGLHEDGGISVENIDLTISASAERAERDTPGYGDDAVIWSELDAETAASSRLTWSFLAFLVLATMLAAIAALIDSAILIVGAMVLGPEFGAVMSICLGLVVRNLRRAGRAARTLVIGFVVAMAIVWALSLIGRWTGLITISELPANRSETGFVFQPDRWSFIVALLAGTAGVVSMTSGRSSALVGVFISVTTVPAAGNAAVAIALLQWNQVSGSFEQLGINLAGMVIAGTLTLVSLRAARTRYRRRRDAVHG